MNEVRRSVGRRLPYPGTFICGGPSSLNWKFSTESIMKGWINSSKLPEAMLRGCCGGFGAGAGASAILASLGRGGCPGRGALCRGVLLGCERWLALALRPRAALVLVWASLSRRRSPFWGEKGFFSGTAARGRVLPSGVGGRDVCGRTVACLGIFWGAK